MLFSFCRNPDIFQKATHQKGLDRRYDIVVIKIQPSIEESKKKSEKLALYFPQEEKRSGDKEACVLLSISKPSSDEEYQTKDSGAGKKHKRTHQCLQKKN